MRPFTRSLTDSFQAAIALALLLAVFLSTPLARYGEVHFSSADLFQDFSLTKVEAGHAPGNKLLSDGVTQMQPWSMFNRDELAAGRVPLWNPWNGAGCPHFANYQSAVFSPFSVPFYFLAFKAALITSAFLKLFALGFFTFLFLRELRLSQMPALLGAIAFMFAGHNVLLLSLPHVGALVSLPAGLFFAEKAVRRLEAVTSNEPGERRSTARVRGPLAGLTLSLTAGLLAGNPEPFCFAFLLLVAWVAARLLGIGLATRGRGRSLRPLVALAAKITFACLLAAGFAAFQLLPFFEYLGRSRVLEQRVHVQTPLVSHFWPLSFFPGALGDPSTPYVLSYAVPSPSFETVNLVYIGGLVVFLALSALVFVRRDRRVAFFLLAGLTWVFYAYDVFGMARLLERIPALGLAPISRSQGLWAFCASCAAALSLDHLLRREEAPAWGRAVLTALGGLAFLAIFRLGVQALIDEYASFPSPNHRLFDEHVPTHLRWMTEVFAAGIVAICLLWIARARWLRWLAGCAIVLVAFLQSGWHFKDYNPVCEDRFFFPATPAIEEIRKTVGRDRVAILGEDGIPPESNLAYGIALIQNYDGMWVRDFDALYRDRFGYTHNWRTIMKGPESALKIFGVPWVLAKWNWNFIDSGPAGNQDLLKQDFHPVEIVPGREVTQTFLCDRERLQAVEVVVGVYPTTRSCALRFELEEVGSGRIVCEREVSSQEIEADVYTNQHVQFMRDLPLVPHGRPLVFSFDPQPDSKGRAYALTLACEAGVRGDTVTTWAATQRAYRQGESRCGGQPLPGEILFAWSCNQDAFELVKQVGDYGLYRYARSLGKYWTVRGVAAARDDPHAIELMRASSFDPSRLVVLCPEGEIAPPEDGTKGGRSRLIRAADSPRTYIVCPDGRWIIPIEEEAVLLARHLDLRNVETVSKEEFARFEVVTADQEFERRAGTRVVDFSPKDEKPPRVIEETPTWIRLEVDCKAPEFLVIAQAHYPGWKARVNGIEKPVYRANYAFSAIEMQRGLNLVDFSYEPESFRLGLWIGLACGLCGLMCLFHHPQE